jgi:hypothetical protein
VGDTCWPAKRLSISQDILCSMELIDLHFPDFWKTVAKWQHITAPCVTGNFSDVTVTRASVTRRLQWEHTQTLVIILALRDQCTNECIRWIDGEMFGKSWDFHIICLMRSSFPVGTQLYPIQVLFSHRTHKKKINIL